MTLREVLSADLDRRAGVTPFDLLTDASWRCTVVMRIYAHLRHQRGIPVRLARLPLGLWLVRARSRHGFDISARAAIGPGLYVAAHPGGVVVNPAAIIGRDCNISHGVTIGQANRGRKAGAPRIGDRVWIGPGAKIVGAITIGDEAVIGPNCVVTDDIPPGAVVALESPRVRAHSGSAGYVNHLST